MSDSVEEPNRSYDGSGLNDASPGDVADNDVVSEETKAKVNG